MPRRRASTGGSRLRKRPDFTPEKYRSRIVRIDARLQKLATWKDTDGARRYADGARRYADGARRYADGARVYADGDTQRLSKRLRRHGDHLFTFLDNPEVPFDNNLAERAIRPAVILRKASQSNRSEQGAATQAVLMTVFRTLKLRGLDPIHTVTAALRTYIQTGELPPLPPKSVAGG